MNKTVLTILFAVAATMSFAQVRRSYVALEATYISLQVADVVLTQRALALGAREANPVMHWVQQNKLFIPGKVLLTGGMLYGCRRIYRNDPRAATWILAGANLLYGAIVFNNYQVCVKMKI